MTPRAALLVVCAIVNIAVAQEPTPSRVQSVSPELDLSDYRFHSEGSDRGLVLLGKAGAVVELRAGADRLLADAAGSLVLDEPDRSLVQLVDLPDGSSELYQLSPKGLFAFGRDESGLFATSGRKVAARARFNLRLGGPRFSNFVQDVNGDGRPDLVIPGLRASELWLQRSDPVSGVWDFERTAEIRVKVAIDHRTGNTALTDTIEESITIPDLDVRDVNGDGRDDIVIVRGSQTRFHRQREDGSYPVDPDVILDLDKFRDTTPKATVRPGRTLAGTEKARQLIRDLDGDGIPDYVVAHRRKVWVFHGDRGGPQFVKPSSILKTADDITGIWLADIDADASADLLVMRVEIPTVGALITGLFGSIEIDMRVLGYRSLDGKEFDRKPTWNNTIEFKLPSLGEILKDPEAIIQRFDRAWESFRKSFRTDLDADGKADLVLLDEQVTQAEIFRGRSDAGPGDVNLDRLVREVFFDEKDAKWDLDRVFAWIEGLGNDQVRRWTEGREADATFKLRDDVPAMAETVLTGDLDGDGAGELIVVYRILETRGRRIFDLWRFEAPR